MAEVNLPPGFGDPASLRRVGDAAQRTASELDRLTATVNKDVANTVPDMFGGESASWFDKQWQRFSRTLSGMGSPMAAYNQGLDLAAGTMKQAQDQLRDALEYNRREGLYIGPDLKVRPLDRNRPDAAAVTGVAQGKLDAARSLAERAQQQVRYANRMLERMALDAQREMQTILGAIAGRGGRRPAARKTPTKTNDARWKEADRDLARSRRELEKQDTLKNWRGEKYRQEMLDTYPMPGDGKTYVAHHNFPVKHHPDFMRVGIDTTNPVWGSWVEEGAHQRFSAEHTRLWDTFFQDNPRPTRDQVLRFGRTLSTRFNHEIGF